MTKPSEPNATANGRAQACGEPDANLTTSGSRELRFVPVRHEASARGGDARGAGTS